MLFSSNKLIKTALSLKICLKNTKFLNKSRKNLRKTLENSSTLQLCENFSEKNRGCREFFSKLTPSLRLFSQKTAFFFKFSLFRDKNRRFPRVFSLNATFIRLKSLKIAKNSPKAEQISYFFSRTLKFLHKPAICAFFSRISCFIWYLIPCAAVTKLSLQKIAKF